MVIMLGLLKMGIYLDESQNNFHSLSKDVFMEWVWLLLALNLVPGKACSYCGIY